jgi:hypothetical protein
MTSDPLQVMFGGADLIVDAGGPDPIVVRFGDDLHVDVPDEPLVLQFAAIGMPGRDGADGAGSDVEGGRRAALAAGMPVAIDRTTARFIAADAAYKPAAFVVGLLRRGVDRRVRRQRRRAALTLADWSAVTGTAQLAPGQYYFLAVGGGLTPVPPASACVAMVGKAVNPTTLLIDPQPPIQL